MLDQFLDRIGDWNPQLMRELKCRLTQSNIVFSTIISLLFQFILFLRPDRMSDRGTPYWWFSTCEILGRGIWLSLAIGGIYLITKDLNREFRNGTLDIIDLTPVQPIKILLGKILGVPILIYWAIFLTLPLHLISLNQIGTIAPHAWIWDLVGLSGIGVIYFNTVLTTIQFSIPPIVLSPILSVIGWIGVTGVNECRLSRRMSSYSSLGVYFSEEWWTISISIINFLVISFVLSKLIQICYPQSKDRHNFGQSWIHFVCNSTLLFSWLVLIGLMPLPMLGITLSMGLIIIFNPIP
jgi:hypothetical protein